MENIIEGNKLIAEFMGFELKVKWYEMPLSFPHHLMSAGGGKALRCEMDDLQFDKSWDWLMTVVGKIEEKQFNVSISSQMEFINDDTEIYWHHDVCISDDPNEIINLSSGSKINSVFQAVIEFIKWYNNLNK
jgi:hypothetical protein